MLPVLKCMKLYASYDPSIHQAGYKARRMARGGEILGTSK